MPGMMMGGFIEARRLPDSAPGPGRSVSIRGDCAQTWRPTFCQSRASQRRTVRCSDVIKAKLRLGQCMPGIRGRPEW
jgi:hypothetical protein